MTDRPFCQKRVYRAGYWRDSSCANRAKAQYDGVWLCGTHSPEAEARRAQKQQERTRQWRENWDRKSAQNRYRNACVNAFHSPDGRSIATEDISEGCVFKLADALAEVIETMVVHTTRAWQAKENARALLQSLNIQEREE